MELDESINFVDSEAVNAYGSVVAKEEHKNPCEHFEEGENVDPPCFPCKAGNKNCNANCQCH